MIIESTAYDVRIEETAAEGKLLYVATCAELPDLEEYADTKDQARELIFESIALAQEMCNEQGTAFPRPNSWNKITECPRCMYDYSLGEWRHQLKQTTPYNYIPEAIRCCPACGIDVVCAGFEKADQLMQRSNKLRRSARVDMRIAIVLGIISLVVYAVVDVANSLLQETTK